MIDAAQSMAERNPESLVKVLAGNKKRLTSGDLKNLTFTPGLELIYYHLPSIDFPYIQIYEIKFTSTTQAPRKFQADVISRVINSRNEAISPDGLIADVVIMHLPDGSIAINNGTNIIHLPNNENTYCYLKSGHPNEDSQITSLLTKAKIRKILPE